LFQIKGQGAQWSSSGAYRRDLGNPAGLSLALNDLQVGVVSITYVDGDLTRVPLLFSTLHFAQQWSFCPGITPGRS
jgi:hypothetical protein